MGIHETRCLTTPEGAAVSIDALMTPLISQLWLMGVQTWFCCQGYSHEDVHQHFAGRYSEADRLVSGYVSGPWRDDEFSMDLVLTALRRNGFETVAFDPGPVAHPLHVSYRFVPLTDFAEIS